MDIVPQLTIGLPVYNGARYIAQSIEALLGQSFDNFEFIISDNASTDGTGDICRHYAKLDSRIKYFRQPCNIGLSANHNFTLNRASGELFKWASYDDLYARDLLKLCVEALDTHPDVVLAHSWTARIDGSNHLIEAEEYPLSTASPKPSERFRSVLFDFGGDDDYGVIRTAALRSVAPYASHHHAARTLVAKIALRGPFYHVPLWLYFRRNHAEQAEFKYASVRANCANMDPRRADPIRNPVIRLYAEYVWGYVSAINRSPLPFAERRACYRHLMLYLASRVLSERTRRPVLEAGRVPVDIDSLIMGVEKKE
jgi:glycosyltransferase involved in cell wall biosynthesis